MLNLAQSPAIPYNLKFAGLAHQVERMICNQKKKLYKSTSYNIFYSAKAGFIEPWKPHQV